MMARIPCLAFLCALLIVVAAAFSTPAVAQVSPGPLSKAHKSLDGVTQCTTCHKFGGAVTLKCVDCHTEIGTRIAARRGYHARIVQKPGSQDCARCHSEHNGLNFPVLKFDPRTFDHNQTGYKLEGKHAGIACAKCHAPSHIAASERAQIKMQDITRTFLGLSANCVPCHEDFHKGQLGQNCLQCHNVIDWKKATEFDHSKTRYPLTGAHVQVKCEKCHTPGPDGAARYKGLPFDRCNACHADPHKGEFKGACQSCHNTATWKKINTASMGQQFDHSKTKYPLVGKHLEVACESCHKGGDFKKALVFAKCTDCHTPDPHSGQFAQRPGGGECSSCHTLDGWKPTTFLVKDHATSKYALEGKHAEVKCEKCHIPAGKATVYKIKFAQCLDCHVDEHAGQFAAGPNFNKCERCHDLNGYKPATFPLAKHKETRFPLTGGHMATPCEDCHKESETLAANFIAANPATANQLGYKPVAKPTMLFRWEPLVCTSCHEDVHNGQFKERMDKAGADGKPLGCVACHNTKTWKDLSKFDHSKTKFPLLGSHRAVECGECHKPSNLETKLIHVDFRAAPTKCEDCHEEVHGGQFAESQKVTACDSCHNVAKWKPSTFDHTRRSPFSIQGAHINVRCNDCHKLMKDVAGKPVRFYKPTPRECEACHGANVPPEKKGA